MVYRGMDIGTGKPPPKCCGGIRITWSTSSIRCRRTRPGSSCATPGARSTTIRARGKLPLLVGGTMLYFRALRRGLADMPAADPRVRAAIDAEAARAGWPALHAELAALDPQPRARIQPNDAQRIQRALEVHRLTGKTLSELHAAQPANADLTFAAFAWVPGDRERLYAAIESRFHAMMRAGLLEEVRRLYARGDLHADLPAIRSVGYRQLWEHLSGRDALDFCNTTRNFRDAASGAAPTDLVARRARSTMARRT